MGNFPGISAGPCEDCKQKPGRYSLPIQAVLCDDCEETRVHGGPRERAKRLRTRTFKGLAKPKTKTS